MSNTNPRYKNGNLRRKYRKQFIAMQLPCHICKQPIDYSIPSTPNEPWGFVIDEVKPVSLWRKFNYSSPEAAAQDFSNLAPAHRRCNALKGNKLNFKLDGSNGPKVPPPNIIDGDW